MRCGTRYGAIVDAHAELTAVLRFTWQEDWRSRSSAPSLALTSRFEATPTESEKD